MSANRSLVVGAGGLLGSAVAKECAERGDSVTSLRVPWADREASVRVLTEALVSFVRDAGEEPWTLFWCAGTGVVATGEEEFAAEKAVVEQVLVGSTDALRDEGLHPSHGTVFFASSAGATFAGNTEPPFSEGSDAVPLAPYGRSKLALEELFASWAASSGARLLIGRISNLYGPGQNILKPQGLISQLIAARLDGRTSNIYVPMGTVRDYLYVDDAAAMIRDAVDLVAREAPAFRTLKIFASQEGLSITDLVERLEGVLDRKLDIVSGHDPAAVYQALDLRFVSRVLTEVDDRELVPVTEGMRRTAEALERKHAEAHGPA
ncbi:dTDP-4-dehydro-6-deoxyglucose reductase [Frondihabitans sp. 762G35]|uniref:NAD-dependent epimerase/dehydratase family protein n=1 Tax=Frondihabitans sp. 762G35 TaxID=1446794 RepID=UPI000D2034E2|nr:NAD-dependent epimerase/dehydratase family protein [Frondihabitans sp. 762G35]ARC57430.1 dTDP-4-dehydro-6-deoxyglucose reductase [Frondihabitans sp. 762G35]